MTLTFLKIFGSKSIKTTPAAISTVDRQQQQAEQQTCFSTIARLFSVYTSFPHSIPNTINRRQLKSSTTTLQSSHAAP